MKYKLINKTNNSINTKLYIVDLHKIQRYFINPNPTIKISNLGFKKGKCPFTLLAKILDPTFHQQLGANVVVAIFKWFTLRVYNPITLGFIHRNILFCFWYHIKVSILLITPGKILRAIDVAFKRYKRKCVVPTLFK